MKEWGNEGSTDSLPLKVEATLLLLGWLVIFGQAVRALVALW